MRPVKIGVPQGSILGPLLFILFINDLPSQLSHSESTMFADDTTVLTEGSSIHDLNVKLNLVAKDLSTWTQQNRMVTNTLKTKSMLIHSPQQLKNSSDRSLSVTLNGNILAQVKQAKVLEAIDNDGGLWPSRIRVDRGVENVLVCEAMFDDNPDDVEYYGYDPQGPSPLEDNGAVVVPEVMLDNNEEIYGHLS
ncbi:Hypothetical predicted protein [Paramuricea clavata]|uniref:Uncharacterized protein n=1 Tax=Paramuricea clavata TaxID=317549 RepID=A0A6S7FLL4_PARCT|nr:Hypothetical predicted protein [Paramuricea clavata]